MPVVAALAAASSCLGLTPTEWKFHQALSVPAPGLVRVQLEAESFDAGGAQMEAFRVLGPDGKEIAILADRPPVPTAHVVRPSSFDVKVNGNTTEILITTGTSERLANVTLEAPAPSFLRSTRVEVSPNKSDWVLVDKGLPIFREWGAEKMGLSLGGRTAAYVRITVTDVKDEAPIPFTGASLLMDAPAGPVPLPIDARIVGRDEFAGETVLTVALEGANVPLAAVGVDTQEPLFMRRVSVAFRETRNGIPGEHIVGSGTLFRVALNGSPAREQVEIPLVATPPTRELLVHVHNGDAPPLSINAIRLKRWPVSLLFMAPVSGNYQLLSGNPQALAPHYDLASFAEEMRGASAATIVPGPIEETSNYHPSDSLGSPPLPDIPLLGAPLDAKDWAFRSPVQVTSPGVQELELNLDALSRARPDFADLRLLKDGNQIPYVLEQPALARSLSVSPAELHDPKRASISTWALHLPKAGLPIRSVALTTTTALFQRQIRIFEKLSGDDGRSYECTLATAEWGRTPQPGATDSHVFDLGVHPLTDTLLVECDNGDNPAIMLGTAQVLYPVVRLVFKTADTDGFTLAYGNREASPPRYDLALVAGRLLTSSRTTAHLGDLEQGKSSASPFAGTKGGFIFWGSLALVVVALLLVVAKLLPRPSP
jgi:hypothetical protein